MSKFNRRDFLKIASTIFGGTVASSFLPRMRTISDPQTDRPNVLILLFDTLSAPHMSLYGYERETTPNLTRFADKAMVYHSHYSEGSFTPPGTASILTGLLPWHHRAINSNGLIRRDLIDNNLFRVAGNDYFRIGFSQNLWADIFLRQFNKDLDLHLPASSFSYPNPLLLGDMALSDPVPYLAYDDFLVGGLKIDSPYSGSITLGMMAAAIDHGLKLYPELDYENQKKPPFNGYIYYKNRMVFQGIYETLMQTFSTGQRPFLGYFHLWSPHEPYSPADEFIRLFQDDLKFPFKPKHPLVDVAFRNQELKRYRLAYDQYIANVDAEFGILMDVLEDSSLLDNTYVFVISDHGQLFERGVHGHGSRLMYDEGIHTPLLISVPQQMKRIDVYEPTCNVDLFPTLATIMGIRSPSVRFDGRILPGFGGTTNSGRSIFSIQAKENSAFQSLAKGSFVLIKGTYKLILYTGYPGYKDIVELYDLATDPYEMQDLSMIDPNTVNKMKEELLTERHAADKLSAEDGE